MQEETGEFAPAQCSLSAFGSFLKCFLEERSFSRPDFFHHLDDGPKRLFPRSRQQPSR
jgi:hypothetical protein